MTKISINDRNVSVVEYKGQRVVTLAMVDEVHQRPKGTARRNFNINRHHLVEHEDYVELTADEIRTQSLGKTFAPRTSKGIVLTESGYLMLVKSFTDDLAWSVQRQLVNKYFRPALHGDDMTMRDMEAADLNARVGASRHVMKLWGKAAGAWAWKASGLPLPPKHLLTPSQQAVLDLVDNRVLEVV